MSDENDSLLSHIPLNATTEDGFGYLRINCTERIVKQVDIRVTVASTGEGETSLLSS